MIAKILDRNSKNLLYSIRGDYENGVFYYKEGSFLKKTEKEFVCDFNLTFLEGKNRVGLFYFNGKDYIQLSYAELGESESKIKFSAVEFSRHRRIVELSKNNNLKKPLGLQNILTFATIALLLIAMIGSYYSISANINALKTEQAPFLNSVNTMISIAKNTQNQNQLLYNLLNNSHIIITNLPSLNITSNVIK